MPRNASTRQQEQPVQRKPSVAWPPFAKALASALARLEEDQFLVISTKQGDHFVQFAGQRSFGLRAETASNGFPPKSEQFSDAQIKAPACIGGEMFALPQKDITNCHLRC
jgi:L-2-hydroxyglutarate oxidase LhgO